ncbi:hypothetical protein MQC88_05755 [Luteimonas sp. 50]|uniref:Glycosyltransferase RgtA/B/C/D-like domain-containing protein n=1 Tax=Cognatiluteimonas sedimenti TaxID=2927791 RepID=A0ABT0A3B4_9GAMM|nr:hypothetical protein [Lysobacter sedimenti]MCJ0825466.1 hypothetical protein [Lysobacter sedimenti]
MFLAVAALLAAALVARCSRLRLATALALAWLLALAWFAGPLVVAAGLLLAVAAFNLGGWLVPQMPSRQAVATTVGLLVIAGIGGWLLALPIHYRLAWLVALLLPVLLRARAAPGQLEALRKGWSEAVDAHPAWSSLAIMLLGVASTACWIPSIQADDVGYHLRLPAQLLADHAYAAAPEHQIWAYASWGNDVLHAIVTVLAGTTDARGGLNGLWLALIAGLTWSLVAVLGGDRRACWAAVALSSSVPLLAGLAGSMHTELAATAALLAIALLAVVAPRRSWLALACLFAGLAALKLVHAWSALPLLAWCLWRFRSRWSARAALAAATLSVPLAGSSYLQAWLATGNPVLPLFNGVFASPYAPVANFDDPRWHAGLGPGLPWTLVFDTPRFLEDGRAALGFASVALLGGWLAALLEPRLRTIAGVATLVFVLPLFGLQYARYAFPGLMLLLPIVIVAVSTRMRRGSFALLVVGLCALNACFIPNGNWSLGVPALKRYVTSGGDPSEVFRRFLPEREVLRQLRQSPLPAARRGNVLATDPSRPYVAELGRRGRNVSWYSPALQRAAVQAGRDADGSAWRALFARHGVRWVLVGSGHASPALMRGIAGAGGSLFAQSRDVQLWQLDHAPLRQSPTR